MNIDAGCHITKIRVRYAETDKMGLAYYGHYLTWFEVGRTEYIRDTGIAYSESEKSGLRLPVIEAGVKYLKPAYYDDVLTIKAYFVSKPGLRLKIDYEIWRDDTRLATGFTEHVFTDENLKPKRPPKKLLNNLIEQWEKFQLNKDGVKHDR